MMFPGNIILMMRVIKSIIWPFRWKRVTSKHLAGTTSQCQRMAIMEKISSASGKGWQKNIGDQFVEMDEKERYNAFREYGLKYEMAKLKRDLEDFRVTFDVWFSETSLYQNGKIDEALADLRKTGYILNRMELHGYVLLHFGDDKDRVLIKQDGSYTYLLPDIAYHRDKLERGFEKLINIWGADHHGYIPRMKAAIQALGFDGDTLEVEIIQLVHLYKDGEKMKMSKRTGKAVTMRELVEEVGLDATRYFFAMRSADTHLDFDLRFSGITVK